jgi:hypothetical protein
MNLTFLIIFFLSFVVIVGFSLMTMKQVEKSRNKRALSIIKVAWHIRIKGEGPQGYARQAPCGNRQEAQE